MYTANLLAIAQKLYYIIKLHICVKWKEDIISAYHFYEWLFKQCNCTCLFKYGNSGNSESSPHMIAI